MNYKIFLKNYFYYFSYFHKYLQYRVFVSLFISLLVGLLDGIGLALFIPLIKLIVEDSTNPTSSENLDFISGFIINTLGLTPSLLNIFALIFIFFSFKGIAQFFETFIRVLYQQNFIRSIRLTNINYLNRFDYKNFLKADSGRIQNTFSGEVGRVNAAYNYYFKAVQYGVLVFVYVSIAFVSNWEFTFLALAGGLVMSSVYNFFYKRTKYFSRKFTKETHVFQNLMLQNVHLFKYLKATGLNLIYGNKLKENIYSMEATQKKLGVISALLGAIKEPLTILLVFGSILLYTILFSEPVGAVLLSLILLYRAIVFFMALQEQWNSFLGLSGSLENMQKFEKELAHGAEENGNEQFSGFQNKMELKDVSFGFDHSKKVLDTVNLEIYKNQTLAIVGESGAGKSTLLNIISGLLFPTEGQVIIDGTSVRDMNLYTYKPHLGYIVQDATIFSDTIYNNISFWAPKTEENYQRFLKAAKQAAILDFINSLPKVEETKLGSNGINISGGQKQRISIARELFKEVSFLFMDEATSSLDGETELVIQQNINNLKGLYTIVIIAHRLATIKNADRIVLIKNGKILETGTFDKLMKNSIEFQNMVLLQNL